MFVSIVRGYKWFSLNSTRYSRDLNCFECNPFLFLDDPRCQHYSQRSRLTIQTYVPGLGDAQDEPEERRRAAVRQLQARSGRRIERLQPRATRRLGRSSPRST